MKKKATIEKELRKLERFRKMGHKGLLDERDIQLNYGAAQAIGWVLSKNYGAASSCIVTIKKKAKP